MGHPVFNNLENSFRFLNQFLHFLMLFRRCHCRSEANEVLALISPSLPEEKSKSPGLPQESPNESRRRCRPFRSCINNYDCGRNGICIGSFGSGYV